MTSRDDNFRLTPTSYIVLGFLALLREATPYDLKRAVAISVGYFWSFPHSQLYAEPERLAGAGYVTVAQEPEGRRRKLYALTDAGHAALDRWRAEPLAKEGFEIRDIATLKLFFGADPQALARGALDLVEADLRELDTLSEQSAQAPPGPRLALEYGIHMWRASAAFWSDLAEGPAAPDQD